MVNNMKTSQAFRKTLKYISNGRSYFDYNGFDRSGKSAYVCVASKMAGVDHIVQPIISQLIFPYASFEMWVYDEMRMEDFPSDSYKGRIKLQRTRKEWVKHLIKHYESIGD